MRKRREFTTAIKVKRYVYCNGKCESCEAVLSIGKLAYDHHNPDGLTGDPTFENCRVLCLPCHAEKTKVDIPAIAKAKRREAKNLGAVAPKQPIPAAVRTSTAKEPRISKTPLEWKVIYR